MKKHNIIQGTVIIMILVFLGKASGFLKEAMIASRFGASFYSDIYVFAFSLTSILFSSVGNSVSTTFIPLLSEKIEKNDRDKTNKFINNVFNITIMVATILTLITVIFAKEIVFIFGPGFLKNYGYDKAVETISLTRIMLISIIFIAMQSVFSGVLNANKEHFIPSGITFLFNITSIIYLIFLNKKFGITGLFISIVIGFFIQVLVHMPSLRTIGYKYSFEMDFHDKTMRRMFKLILPVIIGNSFSQINLIVDRMIATLLGSGAISTLNYANKLNLFFYGIISVAFCTVIFTEMSITLAKNDFDAYKNIISKSITYILFILVPITFIMAIFRTEIVTVAFKRGMFTQENVVNTSKVFLLFSPAIICYAVSDILCKACYAMKDTKTPMITGGIGVIVNIILNIILSRLIGFLGLALSTSTSAVITTVGLIVSMKKRGMLDVGKIMRKIMQIVAISGVVSIIAFIINKELLLILGGSNLQILISLSISTFVAVILFLFITYKLRIEEVSYIISKIQKRFNMQR